MRPAPALAALLAAVLLALGPAAAAPAPPITLVLDVREAPRHIWHARLTLPSPRRGLLTLHYPRWLPGAHAPVIPVVNLAGLVIRANGALLPWHRDELDLHTLRVEVPSGVAALEIEYDYLVPAGGGRGAAVSGERMALIDWAFAALYPDGEAATIQVAPRLRLPPGWSHASALVPAGSREPDGEVVFAPVSLERLVDSPVLAGAFLRRYDLGQAGGAAHEVAVACAAEAGLFPPDELVAAWRRLPGEALALFGARHYGSYHFLLSLLGEGGRPTGLEHHESSDNRGPARLLADEALRRRSAGLLAHEFVHSWNGKYRRPAGLVAPDFQQPTRGDLLWVYEGLTSYLGEVLAARAGLRTPAQSREWLALIASDMEHRPGRAWRPLQDTAVAAAVGLDTPEEWASWRRGHDYYPEGALLWLEVDALLRKDSGGQRALDDLARGFFGAPGGASDGGPEVKPYRFEELVAALDAVSPPAASPSPRRDWRRHLRERLDAVGPHAPLAGLEASGWRLVYSEQDNEVQQAVEASGHTIGLRPSLGMTLKDDGTIVDVIPGMPAARAGAGPGMKVRAVNGRRFSPEVLRGALAAGGGRGAVATGIIELLVESDEWFRALRLEHRGGVRQPHLERIGGAPDLLTAILAPRALAGK